MNMNSTYLRASRKPALGSYGLTQFFKLISKNSVYHRSFGEVKLGRWSFAIPVRLEFCQAAAEGAASVEFNKEGTRGRPSQDDCAGGTSTKLWKYACVIKPPSRAAERWCFAFQVSLILQVITRCWPEELLARHLRLETYTVQSGIGSLRTIPILHQRVSMFTPLL